MRDFEEKEEKVDSKAIWIEIPTISLYYDTLLVNIKQQIASWYREILEVDIKIYEWNSRMSSSYNVAIKKSCYRIIYIDISNNSNLEFDTLITKHSNVKPILDINISNIRICHYNLLKDKISLWANVSFSNITDDYKRRSFSGILASKETLLTKINFIKNIVINRCTKRINYSINKVIVNNY